MRQWATRKKCKFFINYNYKLDNSLFTEPRAVDPNCFDADLEPDPHPAQNLDADLDPDPDWGGGGGRLAKNLQPPLAKS